MARTERSKQKAREKAKKKSHKRKQARRGKVLSARKAVTAPLEQVAQWDWSECFASEIWHERGARVKAIVVRRHASEARTAVIFDIDLDRGGVLGVDILKGVHAGEVQNEVIRISGGEHPLMVVDPGVVLALVQAAMRRAFETGASDHKDLDKALLIFGDTRPDKVQILTGSEQDPGDDPKLEPEGLWDRIKRGFGS